MLITDEGGGRDGENQSYGHDEASHRNA